jgi:tetratricopeptide (TPR) repeat protein
MKKWLGGRGKTETGDAKKLSVDELMTLGRPDEARERLEARLRESPTDLRAQAKLGDVMLAMHRPTEALTMWESAAAGYAADGFHDKASAVLQKMLKVAPNHEKAILGLEQLQKAKERDRRRTIVVQHLSSSGEHGERAMDAFRINQLWKTLSRCSVLEALDTGTLGRLFEYLEQRRVPKGTRLANRGDSREELYIVARGRVDVIEEREDAKPIVMRAYQPGDVFGEAALLDHRLWNAVHLVGMDSLLLCLSADSLAAVLAGTAEPRRVLEALRVQRHDASLAAMVITKEET